jgi:hypothetical protein
MPVSPQEIIMQAMNTLDERNGPLKNEWKNAVRKAGKYFTSSNPLDWKFIHNQLELYNSGATSCSCPANLYHNPCYHRAFVLLQLRYAEANPEEAEWEINQIPF